MINRTMELYFIISTNSFLAKNLAKIHPNTMPINIDTPTTIKTEVEILFNS